jgi:hypothetical protein
MLLLLLLLLLVLLPHLGSLVLLLLHGSELMLSRWRGGLVLLTRST